MPYKDVLVYLDPTSDNENRLDLAVSIARSHGARLTGINTSSDQAFAGEGRQKAVALADLFKDKTKNAMVTGRYHPSDHGKSAMTYAHYADLLIAPQSHPETRELVVPAVPEDILIKSGVPMLILPFEWRPQPVGERVVVAWNASREATRAVHDAMPLFERARKVTVFEIKAEAVDSRAEAGLVVDHLRAHGVEAVSEFWSDTGELTAVEALFACLDTQEADLIVAGAYGHSRVFEGLFGGASHDLIHQPSIPVLMSH